MSKRTFQSKFLQKPLKKCVFFIKKEVKIIHRCLKGEKGNALQNFIKKIEINKCSLIMNLTS